MTKEQDVNIKKNMIYKLYDKKMWPNNPYYIHEMTSRDSGPIFLATSFIQKMPENSDCMYSSIYMLENTWYQNFT